MRSALLFAVCCVVVITAFPQQHAFKLTGILDKDHNGPVFLTIGEEKKVVMAKDKRFELTGSINRPVQVLIRTTNLACQTAFFLDTGNVLLNITVTPKPNDLAPCLFVTTVKGSKADDLYRRFQRDLHTAISNKDKSIADHSRNISAVFVQYASIDKGFSYYPQALFNASKYLLSEDLEKIYSGFDSYQKTTLPGEQVRKMIAQRKITATGTRIADFSQKDKNGKSISLSDLKGRPVLIEFWASWCAPCRAENPNLLKAYERFHPKGLEILAISLDDNRNDWLNAIDQDKLPWIHVSDLKGWKNEVAQRFSLSSIPFNILLDSEGKVVATGIRDNALHVTLKDLFERK